ncbi:MAG: ABC transporter ATP-binding protein, partial [Chloroflexi bacterium]|nr:ABC transporter ATP-binding protein [Chloroflexota bacterium]
VRLAFAVAAHLEPEILLVDEVLAVGDMAFQRKCLGKMEEVAKGGRTVIFVSHNMASIANLCDKTVWLDAGRLVRAGVTNEIVSAYVGNFRNTGGEVNWPDLKMAPGNDRVKLTSVRVKADGVVTSDVLISKEITIEIDYCNFEEDSMLDITFLLRDKTNSFVLASANRPSANLSVDKWYGKRRPRGIYRSTCVIPANFLNDDYYTIDVGISVTARGEWEAFAQNVIGFVVHDTGEMKKEYSGSWVGVVRPKLAWSTHYLGEEKGAVS